MCLIFNPKKDVTVSLQGSGILFALNRNTQTLDLLCTTNGTYTADVVQWRNVYCGTNRQAQAFLLCSEPGSGVITHGYSHPQNAEVACAKTLSYAAYSIRAMQITSEEDSSGITYNPCGIAIGGSAKFKIDVEPVSVIPDDKITWSVAQGDVSFASGNNHGRIVTVNGGSSEADFKLEIDIENGNLPQKPFFTGKTLIPTIVPVTVWIVQEDNGQNPPITPTQFNFLMDDVNKLHKQVAMSFTLNGNINYTNATSLMNITMTNLTDMLVAPILLDLPKNSTNGIKMIFINKITNFNGVQELDCGGINSSKGIVLTTQTSILDSLIIAHEIGHACGLKDIYLPTAIKNQVPSREDLQDYVSSDWAGGYYGDSTYGSLIRNLLMLGYIEDNDPTWDISTGLVFGAQTISGSDLNKIKTGLSPSMNRHPVHQ